MILYVSEVWYVLLEERGVETKKLQLAYYVYIILNDNFEGGLLKHVMF